jgi:hypothetical protein
MERTCRTCKSNGPFYPSYIAHHNYLCKQCACKSVKQCRLRDPSRLIAYRIYNTQRRKKTGHVVSYELVCKILKHWEFKSALSGEKDLNQLCIVPYFRDLPLSEWNNIVLTRHEARRFSHLKTRIHDEFPQDVQKRLEQAREINNIGL